MAGDVKIQGEPMTVPTMCRFTVDRPVYPDQSFHFGSAEAAELSPLASRVFGIEGGAAVLSTDNRITITKYGPATWPEVGQQVGAAIREHIASGELAVSPEIRESIPPVDVLRDRIQGVLDREINPDSTWGSDVQAKLSCPHLPELRAARAASGRERGDGGGG